MSTWVVNGSLTRKCGHVDISVSGRTGRFKMTNDKFWSLRLRHDGRDGVSNHQPHYCLLNRLFRRRSKKTWKLRVTGLCVGNSPVTSEFPAQMASNAENVSIWWRHHGSGCDAYPLWIRCNWIILVCICHWYIHTDHYKALNLPVWWTPSGIYGIEGPSEICTQSAEVQLAVSGAQPLFTLGLPMFALSLVDFLSLLLSPGTYFNIFYFVKSIIWITHTKSSINFMLV